MKIIVLGCGNIGSVVARDIAENMPSSEVVLGDVNEDFAQEAASRIGLKNISSMRVDASKRSELTTKLKGFDVAVGALPGQFGYRACEASIAAKVDMVDVSYMPEDVMTLNEPALEAGVSVVPDCGMSPGLCSMLVGRGASRLDVVEDACMLNGGLPESAVPPLGYVITWSVRDLIDMYVRKVSIIKDGKIVQVEPLSGLETVNFPGVGKLEAFFTDGLRTLLHTVKAKNMWEKTLRYPGHVEKIKFLKDLGFFDANRLEAGGVEVEPREVTAVLFSRKLKREVPDIVVIRIEVSGKKSGKYRKFVYEVFDRYDEKRQVTSMARTTAYSTSIVTQLLAHGAIKDKGVLPPEKLGMNEELFEKFTGEMKKRGILIKEESA